jgi:hypothetical protein
MATNEELAKDAEWLRGMGMITDKEYQRLQPRAPEPDRSKVVGLNKFGDLTVGAEVTLPLDLPNPITLPERRDRK